MIDAFGDEISIGQPAVFAKTVGKGGVELAFGVVEEITDKGVKVLVTHEPVSRAGSYYMGNHPEEGKSYRVTVSHRIMGL